MRWMPLVVLASVVSLSACSDSGGSDSSPCTLASSGNGAATWSFDGAPGCVIPFAGSAGIDMSFIPLDGALQSFEIDVHDVREGETGTFTAAVRLKISGTEFQAPATCSVTISEHSATAGSDGFSRAYQTAGDGSCAAAATQIGGSGSVSVEPFMFRFPAHWAGSPP